jgi:hypothetical protein
MSTPVMQRTPSSMEMAHFNPGFDLHDGGIEPIKTIGNMMVANANRIWLPNNPDTTEFTTALTPDLPPQIDSRHQVYFARFRTEDSSTPIAIKTYNKTNGADNWRKELASLELARRAGLPTLTPRFIARYRSGVTQLATDYFDDLFDLERRYTGDVPNGYEVDEIKLLARSAAALAALHMSGVAHGDAAPRNFAYRGETADRPVPVVIDPEMYTFSHEVSKDTLARLQGDDRNSLVNESASLLAKKEARQANNGKPAKVTEQAIARAKISAEDVIIPVYQNVSGHSF